MQAELVTPQPRYTLPTGETFFTDEEYQKHLFRQLEKAGVDELVTVVGNRRSHMVFPIGDPFIEGSTHTLWTGIGVGRGPRAAKLKKTVMHVAVDEDADGNIVWEKWPLRRRQQWAIDRDMTRGVY